MFEIENLTTVEHIFGFCYPPSFYARANALEILSKREEFAVQFPRAVLLDSVSAIRAVYAGGLPSTCIPFMAEAQPAHVDYYVFDTSSKGPEFPVSVFAGHALVRDWPTYDDFLGWVSQLCGGRSNRECVLISPAKHRDPG